MGRRTAASYSASGVKGRKLRRLASVTIISQFLAAFEATTFPQ